MSMTYWGINGYGICLDDITNYLNKEKIVKEISELLAEPIEGDIFENDTFCGDPFDNFAEFLTELDVGNWLSWECDGHDTYYLLYIPNFPWYTSYNEPRSKEEVADRIVKVIQKVYDVPENVLRQKIDYIDTYGYG